MSPDTSADVTPWRNISVHQHSEPRTLGPLGATARTFRMLGETKAEQAGVSALVHARMALATQHPGALSGKPWPPTVVGNRSEEVAGSAAFLLDGTLRRVTQRAGRPCGCAQRRERPRRSSRCRNRIQCICPPNAAGPGRRPRSCARTAWRGDAGACIPPTPAPFESRRRHVAAMRGEGPGYNGVATRIVLYNALGNREQFSDMAPSQDTWPSRDSNLAVVRFGRTPAADHLPGYRRFCG